MRVILLQQSRHAARQINISVPAVLVGICVSAALIVGGLGFLMVRTMGPMQPLAEVERVQADLEQQRAELDELRARAQEQLDALALRMGELNARAIRLDALGTRLTEMADLDDGEFDFESEPAVGGPARNDRIVGRRPDR